MTQENSTAAFSSEERVREVALRLFRMSELIHQCLRQLASSEVGGSSTVYALLTEEYALRARANVLLIERRRFTRSGFPATQHEVLTILDGLEAALAAAWSPDQLNELILGLMLFANAIAYKNTRVIALLLEDLRELVRVRAE
jgi:hypothetical protein